MQITFEGGGAGMLGRFLGCWGRFERCFCRFRRTWGVLGALSGFGGVLKV